MNIVALNAELTRKIGHVRRLDHSVRLQTGLFNAVTAVIVVGLVAVTIELIAGFDVPERTVLYWSAVALAGLLAAWCIIPPFARYMGLLRGASDDAWARRVGDGIPQIGDRLINTLQLFRSADKDSAHVGYSRELIDASIVREGEPLRAYDYTVIIEREERRRAILFMLAAVLVTSILFVGFSDPYRGALDRLINHNVHFVAPAPFRLEIAPGDRTLILGDSIAITVTAIGIPPRTVNLEIKSATGAPEIIELRPDAKGLFRHLIPAVKSTTTYRAVSGPVRTEEHTIRVVERPDVRSLHVVLSQPSYTGRGTERLPDNVGDVAGMRGSSVSVSIGTNIAVERAVIVQLFPRLVKLASTSTTSSPPAIYDTVRIPMRVDGTTASGGFRLSRDGEYYIALKSADGIENISPVHYTMSVSTDGPPSIALIEPADSVTIDPTMLLPTEVRIADDYGFSGLTMHYRMTASKYAEPWKEFKSQRITIPRGSSPIDVPYIWDMSKMHMVPEDDVEFYFEVADNDAVSGPKRARTGMVKVHFPSLDEVLKDAEQTQQQANKQMEAVIKQAQEARKEMEELNRELMRQLAQNQGEAGWQEKKKMKDLIERHEQMQKKLEEVAENLRAAADKLQQARAMSPETVEKYKELQKLFENLKDPKLLEQMRQMQQQMEKMTPEQMAEAMKNFKFNEEAFRQSIERTMNILKRMQTEQKVDELARRAEEVARQQEELNRQMQETKPNDKAMREALTERQKDLARDAERLKEEAAKLAEQMKGQEDMPLDEMKEAQQGLDQDDPSGEMEQAGEKMQQGDMEKAQQRGDKAKQGAEKFKKKMEAIAKKMKENSKAQVMKKMKKSMQDLLDLSRQQEDLKQQTEEAQPNSQQFRDLAQQQQGLQEQMENIADQMMSLGQKSFAVTPEMGKQLGDAMQKMGQAQKQLESRNGNAAAKSEGGAMASMNSAAKQMGDAISQMENGQGGEGMGMGMGMGMQQRLQQMAAEQQMINEAMGQGEGQGEGEGEGKEGKEGKDGKNGKSGKGGKNGEGENGEGESGDGQGDGNDPRMRRLTQQQERVRKSIEEMNQEERQGSGTRKNTVGDLERAAREIDEVLRDMRSGQVSPETRQRQERILSRLLDAVRSQRERDFERERESRSGVDVVRSSPADIKPDPNNPNDPLRRDPLRSREQGYSKDYEYLIRRYFESLK